MVESSSGVFVIDSNVNLSVSITQETEIWTFDPYYSALKLAETNSVFIIHACAHNPTGCDPEQEQWRELARLFKERGSCFRFLTLLIWGSNSGNVDSDAFAIRLFIERQIWKLECVCLCGKHGMYPYHNQFMVKMIANNVLIGEDRSAAFIDNKH